MNRHAAALARSRFRYGALGKVSRALFSSSPGDRGSATSPIRSCAIDSNEGTFAVTQRGDRHPRRNGVSCAPRPLFHSEADFQHALAWRLQEQHRQISIRLEYR
jgi:hypothetical protein